MQLIERNTWRLIATNVLQRIAGIILNVKTLRELFATRFLSAVTCIVGRAIHLKGSTLQTNLYLQFSSPQLS